MKFDVVLVDPYTIVREGVQSILERSESFRILGDAENSAAALELCIKRTPDVVISELRVPQPGPPDLFAALGQHCPRARVLALSIWDDENSVGQAIRSGAKGFVSKRSGAAELVRAIRAVAQGGSYWSSNVSSGFLKSISNPAPANGRTGGRNPVHRLTPRERQVLTLVAEGRRSREIAATLDLSLETVRTYRKIIVKKLEVGSIAEMTQVALAAGLTRIAYGDGMWGNKPLE
ncbi:MAG: response regulator transcription factor [Bryobacteraceae bacterium]